MSRLRPWRTAVPYILGLIAFVLGAVCGAARGRATHHVDPQLQLPKNPPQPVLTPLPFPIPGDTPDVCPVCGWSPCTEECRLGLSKSDVEQLRAEFREEWGLEDDLEDDDVG